jgi:tRNA acetyltransferase TAN1
VVLEEFWLNEFNIIVTTQRGNERACIREFLMLVEEVKGPKTVLGRTRFPGLLAGSVYGDPVEVIRNIHTFAEEDPWDFRFIQKVVPLQRNVQADVTIIGDAAGDLASSMPEKASFKIVVNKRGSDLKTVEIIAKAASQIKRKVDLENPDWIVQIEIIDDVAGVSVLEPKDILSITRLQGEAMEAQR